jgi:hypothetical protein
MNANLDYHPSRFLSGQIEMMAFHFSTLPALKILAKLTMAANWTREIVQNSIGIKCEQTIRAFSIWPPHNFLLRLGKPMVDHGNIKGRTARSLGWYDKLLAGRHFDTHA